MNNVELLLHPVRIRIVHAISVGGTPAIAELRAQLADLADETVESELNVLVDVGIIDRSEGEFTLRGESAALDTNLLDQVADARRASLTAMVGAFAEEVQGYLDQAPAVGRQDHVTLLQRPIWLTPAELAELSTDVARVVAAKLGKEITGRNCHFLNVTILPSNCS